MIPSSLHLDQAPPNLQAEATQPNPASLQQQNPPQAAPNPAPVQNNLTSLEEFNNDIFTQAKKSADTVEITHGDGSVTQEVNIPSIAAANAPLMSESEAIKSARAMMDAREGLQALGLSFLSDGNIKTYADYVYSPAEKNRLIEAWAPLIQQYNLKVGPGLNILIVEGMCTGPLLATALSARKHRLAAERMARRIAQLENGNLRSNPISLRRDTKTAWKVDDNGFFEHTEGGGYIHKGNRREKPNFDISGTYEMLVRHNGEDYVKQVYKLS